MTPFGRVITYKNVIKETYQCKGKTQFKLNLINNFYYIEYPSKADLLTMCYQTPKLPPSPPTPSHAAESITGARFQQGNGLKIKCDQSLM